MSECCFCIVASSDLFCPTLPFPLHLASHESSSSPQSRSKWKLYHFITPGTYWLVCKKRRRNENGIKWFEIFFFKGHSLIVQVPLVIRTIDTFLLFWTANYKTANKKSKIKLTLKNRFFKKVHFGPRISKTADKKKSAYYDGRLYKLFCTAIKNEAFLI